jgi:hypothetical protein
MALVTRPVPEDLINKLLKINDKISFINMSEKSTDEFRNTRLIIEFTPICKCHKFMHKLIYVNEEQKYWTMHSYEDNGKSIIELKKYPYYKQAQDILLEYYESIHQETN